MEYRQLHIPTSHTLQELIFQSCTSRHPHDWNISPTLKLNLASLCSPQNSLSIMSSHLSNQKYKMFHFYLTTVEIARRVYILPTMIKHFFKIQSLCFGSSFRFTDKLSSGQHLFAECSLLGLFPHMLLANDMVILSLNQKPCNHSSFRWASASSLLLLSLTHCPY